MAQTPSSSAGESSPANVSKSWLYLKWSNPENAKKSRKVSRTVRSCRKCSRSCKINKECFLCKRLGQVSKVYPKLSVKTLETGDAKPIEAVASSDEIPDSRTYRQHWWRCNGPCRDKMPYLGVIRRSTSRPPGPTDKWWSDHVKTCGGAFVKVQNPVVPEAKSQDGLRNGDIRNFLSGGSDSSAVSEEALSLEPEDGEKIQNSPFEVCDDVETKLESGNKEDSTLEETSRQNESSNKDSAVKIETFPLEDDEELTNSLLEVCDVAETTLQSDDCGEEEELASCLACGVRIFQSQLDSHLINCMKDIFDVDFDTVGDGGTHKGGTKNDDQFVCPFCLKSVGDSDLKEHVDLCSSTEASATLFIDES